jgi:hypothetical protein
MDPVDVAFIKGVVIFGLVVPVMAVSARFALMPFVSSFLRLRGKTPGGAAALEKRVHELEGELHGLRGTVAQLEEAETFHRRLAAPADGPALAAQPDA